MVNVCEQLFDYRSNQTEKLRKRLQVFVESYVKRNGKLPTTSNHGCLPIESQQDVDLINKLIDLKSFVTIPIYDDKWITSIYTVGVWYFWNLPEILIQFDKPLKYNTEYLPLVVNLLHGKIYELYSQKISAAQRLDFDTEPAQLNISIQNIDTPLIFERIENDQYMEIKAHTLMWFYMYYMDAIQLTEDTDNVSMYPVYKINMALDEYMDIVDELVDELLDNDDKLNNNMTIY